MSFSVLPHILLGELSTGLDDCWEKRTGSLLLVSLPHVIFSIADLNLYLFVVINLNNEYNCFAKFSEFFWRIIELEGSLGDSQA